MRRSSFAEMDCSIAQTLELVGEWWTLLIIRDATLGAKRFEEFQANLGIARNVLATRLDHLVEAGIMRRRIYDEGRDRADYLLTEMGRELWPVLVTLRQWGDRWLDADRPGRNAALLHTSCGHSITAELHCSACGEPLDGRHLRTVAALGPDGAH